VHLIILNGPTAIGKSDIAVILAKHFHTEVLSADSRQVYRELCIGTAKPEETAWQGITHHLLGHRSILEPYTVADYEQEALQALEIIFAKHETAILCGGTGLYLRAVTDGLDALPDIEPEIRARARANYLSEGIVYLQHYIQEHDPASYSSLDLKNPHRLLRAVETHLATGVPLSAWKTGKKTDRFFHTIKIGLQLPMDELYERINLRVDTMMEEGLLEEVYKLMPYQHLQALQTVGYTELFDHLSGKLSLEEAVEKIKQNTRRYAKRQMTWLRRETGMNWFSPNNQDEIISFIESQIMT